MTLRNAIVVVLTAGVILNRLLPTGARLRGMRIMNTRESMTPLLKKYQEADFRTQLEARFRQVQTDR